MGSLSLTLTAPDGNSVNFLNLYLDEDVDEVILCFSDTAKMTTQDLKDEFQGVVKSIYAMAYFNNGSNPNGIWTLTASSTSNFDEEVAWSITFGKHPLKIPYFKRSGLPQVTLKTIDKKITQEPKVLAKMKVEYPFSAIKDSNLVRQEYDGYVGIEYRGSASKGYSQRSYGISTTDSLMMNLDVPLLGNPSEHDWILQGTFRDRSHIRNPLSEILWQKMGYYAPRGHLCELTINDRYEGVYNLIEKIKRDKNRINIKKLTKKDTVGDNLTGGYIFKIDKTNGTDTKSWNSLYKPTRHVLDQSIAYVFHDPDQRKITSQQKQYLKSYIDSFETALMYFKDSAAVLKKKYSEYIDVQSFIDYSIMTELNKNFDGYRSSIFFYKDRNKKIFIGPVWDSDLAWGNMMMCAADSTNGWQYDFGKSCPEEYYQIPFWWEKMLSDPVYKRQYVQRWKQLRLTVLSDKSIFGTVDSLFNEVRLASKKHYWQWPPEEYKFNDTPSRSHDAEERFLRKWIADRLKWLDAHIR